MHAKELSGPIPKILIGEEVEKGGGACEKMGEQQDEEEGIVEDLEDK